MIGYAIVGSNDLERSKAFYDALLASIGVGTMFDHPSGGRLYGVGFDKPFLGVLPPYDQKPATVGNGMMISLNMPSRAAVDAFHAMALSLGAADEGAPGLRGNPETGFYACYFRDPQGNKLAAFHFGAE